MSKLCGVRSAYTTIAARVFLAKYMTIPITTPIIIALTEKGKTMSKEKRFMIISTVISIITVIVELGFIIAGNALGAGLCLVLGIMGSGMFRFLAEMEGGDGK